MSGKDRKRGLMLNSLFSGIIIAIVAAVAGYFANSYWHYQSNKIRKLNYDYKSNDGMLEVAGGLQSKVKLKIDDEIYDNISVLNLYVYNVTDSDFENIPIYIKFDLDNENDLLARSIDTASTLYKRLDIDGKDGEIIEAYNVNVVNRNGTPFFNITYYFNGEHVPKWDVYTQKKGVAMEYLDVAALNERHRYPTWSEFGDYLLCGVISGLMIMFWFAFKEVRREKKIDVQRDILAGVIEKTDVDGNDECQVQIKQELIGVKDALEKLKD